MKEIGWFVGPLLLLALIWPEHTAHQARKLIHRLEAGWSMPVDADGP
ncbi:hypothetical protein [Bradyrhizobium phage BDU-MI-1]|nr:hypothetical protein [Bradyrhizobium phage BDU-MI-1]